jgi:hypothetical protein
LCRASVRCTEVRYSLGAALARGRRAALQQCSQLFYRLLQQSVNTDPHPLAGLIGGTAVNLCDEELYEEFTLEPLSSNTFGEF